MKKLLFLFIVLLSISIQPQTKIYPSLRAQIETPIAINPTNPNNLILACIGSPLAGGINTPYFYSQDRGVTWNGSDNSPNGVSTRGDPYVIFNKWGDAFFINKGNLGIN